MPIRAVLFDMGGVVLSTPWPSMLAYEAAHGVKPWVMIKAMGGAPAYGDWERGLLTPSEAYPLVDASLRAAGVPSNASVEGLMDQMYGDLKTHSTVVALIGALRNHGLVVGALTNNHRREDLATRAVGFERWDTIFDVVVESCTVGARKPEHRIYHMALYLVAQCIPGILPSEVLFLDDMPANVEAAQQVGMHAAVIGNSPDDVVRVLTPLLPVPLTIPKPLGTPVVAVVFDFNGVLLEDPLDALRKYSREVGVKPSAMYEQFFVKMYYDLERGLIYQEDFEEAWNKDGKLPSSTSGKVVMDRLVSNMIIRPCMVAAVGILRQHGYIVGGLTNDWRRRGNTRSEVTPRLDAIMDFTVSSCESGVRKPEPAMYRLALEKVAEKAGRAVDPRSVIYLDDFQHNIPPAEEVGFQGLHVTDTYQALRELGAKVGIQLDFPVARRFAGRPKL